MWLKKSWCANALQPNTIQPKLGNSMSAWRWIVFKQSGATLVRVARIRVSLRIEKSVQRETFLSIDQTWPQHIIIIIIIIIKHVLIKVTLSCQRHCRGTAQSLTSKKRTGRSADSRWPQVGNSYSVVQLRSPNEDRTTTEKVSLQVTTERQQRRRIPDGWRQTVTRTCGSHWKGTVTFYVSIFSREEHSESANLCQGPVALTLG